MFDFPTLNLPKYNFKIVNKNDAYYIFDSIRAKYYKLNPEEWVRQNFIEFLVNDRKVSKSLIAVEKEIIVNELKRRFDVVVYNKDYNPEILIECKAPKIKINQNVFEQIATYNIILKCRYLVVTNGLNHYFCEIDIDKKQINYIKSLPKFA